METSLIEKINQIIAEWNTADRAVRELALSSRYKTAARAGIERNAMIEVGKLCANMAVELGLDEDAHRFDIGVAAYRQFKLEAFSAALQIARR